MHTRLRHRRFRRSVLPMQTSSASSPRGIPLPLLTAASITLEAGWLIRAGLTRIRAGVLVTARWLPRLCRTRPAPLPTDEELDREEVAQALLTSGHDRFDEFDRPVHVPLGGTSQRLQGATPLNLRHVNE